MLMAQIKDRAADVDRDVVGDKYNAEREEEGEEKVEKEVEKWQYKSLPVDDWTEVMMGDKSVAAGDVQWSVFCCCSGR